MMKKINFRSALCVCALMLVVALAVFGWFEFMFGGTGAVMSMGVAASTSTGPLSTEELGSVDDLLAKDIDRIVIKETKDRAPLNCIMREMKRSKETKSLEPTYFAVSEKPILSKVTAAYAAASTPAKVATIAVSNCNSFSKRDTVLLMGVKSYDGVGDTTGSTLFPLVCLVLERVDETNSIKLQPINGKINSDGDCTFADAIAVNTEVVRAGKAEHELAIRTDGSAQLPVSSVNFCQNFMFEILESEWAQIAGKNVDYELSDRLQMAINDYATTKEISYLLGSKSKTVESVSGKTIFTCDGIMRKITKTFDVTSINEEKMAELMQKLFDGNNGNSTRFAFLGSNLYMKFQKLTSIQKQIDGSKEPFVVFGLEFDRIKFGGNTLLLRKHPLMAEIGMSDKGVCLDMDNIEERIFKKFTKTTFDLKTSGQLNAEGSSVSEVACPIVKNTDTHMLLV